MAREWDAFFPYVMPSMPSVPYPAAVTALRDAAIEFCERTLIWFRPSTPRLLEADEAEYAFAPPANQEIQQVLKVAFIDSTDETRLPPLSPATYNELAVWNNQWETLECDPDSGSYPDKFWLREPYVIRMIPYPTSAGTNTFVIDMTMKPSRDATECPDFLYDHWGEAIGMGACLRLAAEYSKQWGGQPTEYYRRRFEGRIVDAQHRVNKSYTGKSIRIVGRRFA